MPCRTEPKVYAGGRFHQLKLDLDALLKFKPQNTEIRRSANLGAVHDLAVDALVQGRSGGLAIAFTLNLAADQPG